MIGVICSCGFSFHLVNTCELSDDEKQGIKIKEFHKHLDQERPSFEYNDYSTPTDMIRTHNNYELNHKYKND